LVGLLDARHVTDPALKLQSTTLSTLGKQIKLVENECKREDDIHAKHWKDAVKPQLEAQIASLEKKAQSLRSQMEKDVSRGADYLNKLEEELQVQTDKLDELKKQLYFPFAHITFGSGGVYLAMEGM
jgi:septal ring factor EnvC (AmiA/AmiB activator)